MFTGIVEEIGQIGHIEKIAEGLRIKVICGAVLDGTKCGDSIAVDGVCLTAETVEKGFFLSTATKETVERSTVGTFTAGRKVNLERAVRAGDRLGGHMVQGHVDTVAEIVSDTFQGKSLVRHFRISDDYGKYIVEKGSVSIDGISLTVSERRGTLFAVSIIPETLDRTTAKEKRIGHKVNIEVDIIAKYVEQMLVGYRTSALTESKLKEYGF